MRDELLKMEAEYDIPDEVDMSGAIRGYFYTPHKVSVSMRLDDGVMIKNVIIVSIKKGG